MVIWTVGHSTQAVDALLGLLKQQAVELVADVRRYPASRRHPRFGRERLEASLRDAGIDYRWLPDLGGRRAPRRDSRNLGWENEGFRGYADYMETEPFQLALARLVSLAQACRTAIMCAEAAWQQCHRGLISDALRANGHKVVHILRAGGLEPHPWTAPARLLDGRLSYPPPAPAQRSLEL
jgi:uncharacterized protein (DUF488 family)